MELDKKYKNFNTSNLKQILNLKTPDQKLMYTIKKKKKKKYSRFNKNRIPFYNDEESNDC